MSPSAAERISLNPTGSAPALDVGTLEAELRSRIKGEVRFDSSSRLLYSTDASIYQIIPIGVVVPRSVEDVVETVRIAAERRAPLLPRGSGTSLGGQTVGAALVLDFARYLNQVLEVNVAERWARVQPGVILDELNAQLQPHGLRFAPDVATSSRASVGGMIGNNSSGAHSILYGRTVDHVLETTVVLPDGTLTTFSDVGEEGWMGELQIADRKLQSGVPADESSPAPPDGAESVCNRQSAVGYSGILSAVRRICEENAAEIDARFPRIMRRSGGYNLDEIVRWKRYNLAKLVVGSEGTLCTVVEAKINLVPLPACTGLLVSHFDDMIAGLEATPRILRHSPAAVELVDRIILDLSKDNVDLRRARGFIQGEPDAVLATEMYGDTPEEVEAKLLRLRDDLQGAGIGCAHILLTDAAAQKNVWAVRKHGLGLLMGMKGDGKPVGFVEDSAVAPERLAAYIREFRDLLNSHGLTASYYAHASVGCLHVRPILNLKDPADRQRMRSVAGSVADLVLKYGGAMSAEHGDGLVRSEFQERMFGPQVYQAFRQLKAAFDPQGIMNPGKIVDAVPMDRNLRYAPGYQTIPVETILDFSRDGGFARSVELCSGVGECRKRLDGTMCPSFRATGEEMHSTRGRANMLRHVLSGSAGSPDLADPRVLEALDLCLECKACKSECPSNVDMAKLKYEFLAHYQAKHGVPLRSRVFAQAAEAGKLGSAMAPLANWALEQPAFRALLESAVGIDRRRKLPAYASRTFRAWWTLHRPGPRAGTRGEVLLLADTFTQYQEPEIGQAAVRLLEAFGYRVRVPELKCCGRPMISKGLLREARANASHNIKELTAAAYEGMPVVGLEPSCVVTYRDEYREFGLGAAAEKVAAGTWMLEDFLAERHGDDPDLPFAAAPGPVLFHGHCQQKAVLGTARMLRALKMVPGCEVTTTPPGCCGMAGTFGYEKEHYDLSLRIGELGPVPRVRAAPANALIVAPGTSCRRQFADAAGRKAVHPAVALAAALQEEGV